VGSLIEMRSSRFRCSLEAVLEHLDARQLSWCFMAPPPVRFTTQGPVRGPCSHKHKNLESAADCLGEDEALCFTRGKHTDREIFVLEGPSRRKLTPAEAQAVQEHLRRQSAGR